MTEAEFAQLMTLSARLFKNVKRPSGAAQMETWLRSNYPAYKDLDLVDALTALVIIHRSHSPFEPGAAEVRKVVRRLPGNNGSDEPTNWQDAWRRLSDAVHAWSKRRDELQGTQPGLDWKRDEDGNLVPIREDIKVEWRRIAGEVVCDWLDHNGGPATAAANLGSSTYRAQFRDFVQQGIDMALDDRGIAEGVAATAEIVDQLRQLPAETSGSFSELAKTELRQLGSST